MASNQTSNRRRSTSANQAEQTKRHSPPESSSEQPYYRSLGDVKDRAADYYERGEQSLRECVSGREGSAVLLALASGFGVGLIIGATLGRSHRQSQSWRDRITAEGFGRRLMERVESLIPDALAEHFPK
jgi:hypothetical protein